MIKVGIVGAGSMGAGIAQVAATAGHEVFLFDNNEEALKKGHNKIGHFLSRSVEKGRMEQTQRDTTFNNIQPVNQLKDLHHCDLIIEAIIENLDIKKSVFKTLETHVSEQCILATNTSSLSIASVAAACQNPERVIGIHFFNPAPLMKLVEIIPAVQTSEQTKSQASEIIGSWKKQPVITKDTPGFIVNRVARPFYGEALRIYDEGIADIPTIDWAMTEFGGFRMGPFTLMDYIGNDINYTVTETVFKAFYYDPRYKPSFTQKRMAEAGYLGRKSGKGYYDYADGQGKPPFRKNQVLAQQIVDRIVIMLINEAADALFWNIASADDIDKAMKLGVNYPKGLLAWADEIGIDNCVARMDALYNRYLEDRYRCSPLLRDMAKTKQTFFESVFEN